jgi:hypothetical protein
MCNPCRKLRQALRYWIFPESKLVDERTEELDQQWFKIKEKVSQTNSVIRDANQVDALRNLMRAMTSQHRHKSGQSS